MTTVKVGLINKNTIELTPTREPTTSDVFAAFQQVKMVINQARYPTYVIVDLRQNPDLPMALTVRMIHQVNQNPMMAGWLLVGAALEHQMQGTQVSTYGRPPLYWFRTYEGALGYLEELTDAVI